MLEELLPAEELEIGILDPAVTQRLIAQVVHVLEKRQACHQPRRQRRAAGAIRIDRSELHLQKPPIDRARKLHQCMRQINDPISAASGTDPAPRSLVAPAAASLTLPRSSRGQGITASDSKESQKQFCKKTAAPPPNSGKNHHWERLNHPSRSTPWKYFPGDERE